MEYWLGECIEILIRVMIILGIVLLIADILYWIAETVSYVYSEIEFKMKKKKDKGDD